MINRRPHILSYSFVQEALPPYQDENGNMVFPEPVEVSGEVKCRVEPIKSNPFKPSTDGGELIYEFLIFADYIKVDGNKVEIPKGTEIEAKDMEGNVMAKGEVADFANDQRQCRIWI